MSLFGNVPALPDGFLYQPDFLTEREESDLLATFRDLPFAEFDFHGYIAKRRIVEYGWEYDFGSRKATATQPIPEFLFPFRDRAARFAGLSPEKIVEAVVTKYPAGAHRLASRCAAVRDYSGDLARQPVPHAAQALQDGGQDRVDHPRATIDLCHARRCPLEVAAQYSGGEGLEVLGDIPNAAGEQT
jgi:hypothetical protein